MFHRGRYGPRAEERIQAPGRGGHIVPRTGTGGFGGWAGSARIGHDDQGAYFEIELA